MPRLWEEEGDIMDAPPNSIILHACNARGKWGRGVAEKLRLKFPKAFEDYADKCESAAALDNDPDALRRNLVGTCIIKAVEVEDPVYTPGNRIYVASLITSLNYGKKIDEPAQILENTRKAFKSLKNQIPRINADNAINGIDPIDEAWSVKMNSGLFGVEWEKTRAILEDKNLEVGERRLEIDLRVVYPPEPKPRAESSRIPTSPEIAYAESIGVPVRRVSKKRKAVDELYDSDAAEERSAPHAPKIRDRQGSPSKPQVERALTQEEKDAEWELS